MIDLSKRRYRTISTIEKYKSFYGCDRGEKYILTTSSILNFIWNVWSEFWRAYWIVYVGGGLNFEKNKVVGIYPSFSKPQICAYIKNIYRSKKTYHIGDGIPFYSEPTWGDPNIIISIATSLSPTIPSLNYVGSLVTTYKTELEEFQKIRNAYIHLNSNSINLLKSLEHLYVFEHNQTLLDILDSHRISNSKRCIDSLTENMIGCLLNL